ncbi:MAG: hypothetical protein GY874_11775 [Desulfobacteraceae bacterium]|nr:hypothetical protein [Desulfobacteraceae bacterium]
MHTQLFSGAAGIIFAIIVLALQAINSARDGSFTVELSAIFKIDDLISDNYNSRVTTIRIPEI